MPDDPNEARYQEGWFTTWNSLKRRVIADVLRGVPLRAGGRVLDFGCGTGELTRELATRYPEVVVEGTDISPAAVELAQRSFPAAQFWTLTPEAIASHARRYDLLFTHHVIEHVDDLVAAAATMSSLCTDNARMVHMLPCGVPGSLDWRVASAFLGGVQPCSGNRYINEDPGHLRRMRPEEVAALFERHGFRLVTSKFRSQFWGTVEWASQNPLTAWVLASPLVHRSARPLQSWAYTALFMSAFLLRSPVLMLQKVEEKYQRQFRHRTQRLAAWKWLVLAAAVAPSLLMYPVGMLVDRWIQRRATREWEQRQDDPAASEMFLVFERSNGAEAPHG